MLGEPPSRLAALVVNGGRWRPRPSAEVRLQPQPPTATCSRSRNRRCCRPSSEARPQPLKTNRSCSRNRSRRRCHPRDVDMVKAKPQVLVPTIRLKKCLQPLANVATPSLGDRFWCATFHTCSTNCGHQRQRGITIGQQYHQTGELCCRWAKVAQASFAAAGARHGDWKGCDKCCFAGRRNGSRADTRNCA